MMFLTRLLCLFAINAGLLALMPAAMGQQVSETDRRAFSADGSVSLVVPHGWTAQTADLPRGVQLFLQSPSEGSADSFGENVFINEDRLAGTHTLNDYIELHISDTRRRYDGFRVIEDASTQLSGQAARLLVFQYMIQGIPVVQVGYYVARDRIAYMVTGSTLQSEYKSWGQRLKSVCLTFRLQ